MEHKNEMWAVIELMGHGQTAGIIRTSDLGGLLRVDVPIDDGFRIEYFGEQAIYSIKIVSEEIARAYATPNREICSFDTPIIPRAEFEKVLQKSRESHSQLQHENEILRRRLTQVNSLPEHVEETDELPFGETS